jgi:hypothetical protein
LTAASQSNSPSSSMVSIGTLDPISGELLVLCKNVTF